MFVLVSERVSRHDDAGAGPARESRIDFASLGKVEKLDRTPTGGIRVPARVWRSGILVYPKADGTVTREYRPESEAFSAPALASVADALVTVGHPPKLVTPATARRYSVGHARGEGRRDGNFATADLAVVDGDAIARIDGEQLVEISTGYTCIVEPTPGVSPEGERYDAIQREIRANHFALLPRGAGRAGRDVKLRLDGLLEAPSETPTETRTDSMEEMIDGKLYKVGSPEWAAANALRCARLDQLEKAAKAGASETQTKLDSVTAELVTTKTQLEAEKAKVVELTAKLAAAESATKVDSIVTETIAVRDLARRHLGAEEKLDGKSADEMRRMVITKLDGASALLEDPSDAKSKPRSPEMMRVYFDARMRGAADARRDSNDSNGGGDNRAPVLRNQYTPPGR